MCSQKASTKNVPKKCPQKCPQKVSTKSVNKSDLGANERPQKTASDDANRHTQTDGHRDYKTESAQRADLVKIFSRN